MKATFLLWNVKQADDSKRENIKHALNSWIRHEGVNIIALIECKKEKANDIRASLTGDWRLINDDDSGEVRLLTYLPENIIVDFNSSLDIEEGLDYEAQISAALENIDMHNFSNDYKKYVKKEIKERLVWFRILNKGKVVVVCALVHFYAKILNEQERNGAFIRAIAGISKRFFQENLQNIMLFGDFNLNPFDMQMYHNATKSGHLLTFPNRNIILNNDSYSHYFYNPMWLLTGDNNVMKNRPLIGRTNYTFLITEARLKSQNKFSVLRKPHKMQENEKAFNLLDGVLLAKELIRFFRDRIEILDKYIDESNRTVNLVNDDLTLKKDLYSDHLPIIFELQF